MTFKNILTVVSGGPGDGGRLDLAVALAATQGGSVAALYVKPMPYAYAASPGMEMPVALIESQQREIDAAARRAEEAIRAHAKRSGAAIEWLGAEGDEVTQAGLHARYAELVIAGPDLARDLVFVAGAPVLALPAGASTAVPKRILIGWNGSREASRAVRDAMPLLLSAAAVQVLVVDPPQGRAIGARLVARLARHGLSVELHEADSRAASAGALLLERAKSADLLVMGAFGHSRFREWVLGGATESVLKDAKLPVLLSH